uniref:Golgi-body localization protein domain-containing protein n=2 Tax=Kalmanozyma brasiliensis (strain GHG001) TaxID=1365824 RepID=V5EIZ2_KALBG
MDDITAIPPITEEFSRRRQIQRAKIGIEQPPRPKTDIELLRQIPRIAAGIHVERVSLVLDASQGKMEDGAQSSSQGQASASDEHSSRKLVLTVPNVDFVFFGEYKDEYVKRPAAEKRAAYKALKGDSLEWPISGATDRAGTKRDAVDQGDQAALGLENGHVPADSHPAERYTESNLTMEETLKRMREMEQPRPQSSEGDKPDTARRSSIRDTMSKTGKVRMPGYSRKSTLATETRFSLRYQFETSLRVDAVESFLSLSSDPQDSSRAFLRPQSTQTAPAIGSSQHHLLALHSFEVLGSGRIPGMAEPRGSALCVDVPVLSATDTVAEFRASIEDIDIEAWHISALDTYADIAAAIIRAKAPHQKDIGDSHNAGSVDADSHADHAKSSPAAETKVKPKPLVEQLPGGLAVYLSVGRTIAHLGGPDRRIEDKIARGVGLEAERIVIEYAGVAETKTNLAAPKTNWGARTALELSEDLQLQGQSLAARHPRVALARVVLHQAGIFPILDAEFATKQHTEGTASESFAQAKAGQGEAWPKGEETLDRPATSLLAENVWTFKKDDARVHASKQHRPRFRQQDRSNFIFFTPYAACKAVVRPPQSEDKAPSTGTSEDEVLITSEHTKLVSFNIDLLHTYCFLLAFSTFKHLALRAKGGVDTSAKDESSHKTGSKQSEPSNSKHPKPSVSCRFDINEVHTFVMLPRSTRIFMRIRRLEVRQDPRNGLSVSTESIMGAVESPKHVTGNVWEEAVRLRDWRCTMPPKVPDQKPSILVSGDAALIRIPYGYLVYSIIDNTSVAIKATKQLFYQFLLDKDDSAIAPVAEDPKLLPNITFKVRVLTIEAEDDPFETKLNLIWRAGLAENAARDEREAAFAAKAEAIGASRMPQGSTSFRSSRSDGSAMSAASSIRSFDDDDDSYSSTTSHDARSTKSKHQHVSLAQARIALNAFNSSSWVRRYLNAQSEQSRRQERLRKTTYGRFHMSRSFDELPVRVLPIGKAAPLLRSTMYRVALQVGQAHFPIDELRDFIHEKGAGVPKDTPYSLVIPLHVKWEMGEWRVNLRDYPMPLLHVPPTHRAESDTRKAWCFEGDIVIAEQLGGPESIRHVPAVIVPAATGRSDAVEYGIIIPKVAMSVKAYGTPTIRLRTPYPTRVVWGQSIQPTIQDVMRVIDAITPPPHDPSPKLGFWDKLPLILHGHVNLKFEDEGGFNFHMKGSRDPYSIEGHGAGWVKSWKGGVEIRLGYDNPEKEFFQILSHEYVLAIPDLCDYVDHAATGMQDDSEHLSEQRQQSHDHDADGSFHESEDRKSVNASFTSSMYRYMKDPTFRKVVIKLTNGVRWGAGLRGERTCDDDTCSRQHKCKGEPFYRECRYFDRIKHWDVIPKTHEYFDSIPEDERRDSFGGWRSHHLHFAISVFSPKNGLPGYSRKRKDANCDAQNNFYFSPLAWEHFWAWMRLFSSAMSLPIRAGSLFPDSPPPSPKFGRFLGTIKYRIDLAPLFIAHQYRQFSKEEFSRGYRTHVGVKARCDSFTLDMHQRQQETVKERPELGEPRIVFHKPFYEAEMTCDEIDLRAMAARLRDETGMPEAAEDQEIGEDAFDEIFAEDSIVSDDELVWIDMNDFVEIDSAAIKEDSPQVRLFPALVCPQFNYYRKKDSELEHIAGEKEHIIREEGKRRSDDSQDRESILRRLERSKFGNEHTHTCMVGKNDRPYDIQRRLAQDRLQVIRSQIDHVLKSSDRDVSDSETESESSHGHQNRLDNLHSRERILSSFISHIGRIQEHTDRAERHRRAGQPSPKMSSSPNDRNFQLSAADLASLYHDLGMFDNRYVAHNPTLFFSNVTRSLLLKYYYSSRLRRGYAHHMTATAVRYIRDLFKKKDKGGRESDSSKPRHVSYMGRAPQQSTPGAEAAEGLDILHEMLEDTVNHMFGKNGYSTSGWGCQPEADGIDASDGQIRPDDGISDDFNVVKSNVLLLLKPQVVLRSEIDDNSTVIVSALRTRLQNYTVRDESCAEDSVNAVVLRRNFFALDNLQCFHPNASAQSKVKKHAFVSLPLEALIDMHGHGGDFERIVPHTNATMYYDKFNKLRLSDSSRSVSTFRKDGKPVQDHLHHHMDMIFLNCPRFSVSANGEHFAALYNVVTDLILYRDPAHRDHAKRLEEMMFSYDFTDVSGLADIVTELQVRIREARSLVDQYMLVAHRLNERGRAEFVGLLGEMVELVEELNLIMDAITTSQDSKGGADREKKSALRFMAQAQEVAWNMIGDEAGQLVAKLALRGISFSWLNKADNSAANTVSIRDLQALNVDPNAMFAEIITKHTRHQDHPMAREGRFLDAMWSVLPPVGGISIVDTFEFNLHPVKIQIELKVGRKITDYIFGTKRQREKQEEEQKRIEDAANRPSNTVAKKKSPLARLLGGRKQNSSSAGGSSDGSRRDSMNASAQSLSTTAPPSRSASTNDLMSTGRESSDGSREDDGDSNSGRAPPKAMTANTLKGKNSPKSRPGTPSSGKDLGTGDQRSTDQYAIAQRNAAEMRSRASAYRTFVYVKISQTIFCLSYKGEKQKSITDLYDLVFRSPTFEYHNSTFGYVDLADNFKKDVLKAAWNQKSTLLRDIITHRPNRKRNAIESIRAIRQASRARDARTPLDVTVEPPTPNGRSSFDGSSSHLADSPTDTFSYRGSEEHRDDDEDSGYGDVYDDDEVLRTDSPDSHSEDGLGHDGSRNGAGQTLAGQIRDAWGRSNSNEAASQPVSNHSGSSGEVDDLLTPQQENQPRRFPSLGRSSRTPTSEGPPARSPSPSSSGVVPFKLNKLIPKSLRQRTGSASGASGSGESGARRNSYHATSPLHEAGLARNNGERATSGEFGTRQQK